MNSPFPGTDPYLERYWPAVHTQLVASAARMLNLSLPPDLVARPEERLAVTSPTDFEPVRTIVADAAVLERSTVFSGGSTAIVAPFELVAEFEAVTERYIKILAEGDRLITVIEFVSPANKTGEGLEKYLKKRNELLDGNVHVVEIDLVRRGNWRELLKPHDCPADAVAEYRGVIRLAGQRNTARLFPWSLRTALPPIPIPLRMKDAPLNLDIQQLLKELYSGDRYGSTIDYSIPPRPPLAPETDEWASLLLREHGISRS
jgi:hypothetical protein